MVTFWDDCLLFVKAKCNQVLVKEMLETHCKASRLKVNIQKSVFMPSKNIPRRKLSKFTSIIEFAHTTNLGRYLGFPLLTRKVKKDDFAYIINNIILRLAGWKGKVLNRVGRVTIANLVVAAIPTYSMQNFAFSYCVFFVSLVLVWALISFCFIFLFVAVFS